MKTAIAIMIALVASTVVGCSAPSPLPTTSSVSSPPLVVASYEGFMLLTHCGITHAVVNGTYYAADPALSDGSGNPPDGWGNPYQQGVMTVRSDGSAEFVAGPLRAGFVAGKQAPSDVPCD